MNTQKFILLFVVLPFGAYLQHDAEKNVMEDCQIEIKPTPESSHLLADVKFMKRAIELGHMAVKGNDGDPFGCAVVRNGEIVGEGWKSVKVKSDSPAHAVVDFIRHACSNMQSANLQGSVLYTSAKPCPLCLSLIHFTSMSKGLYCIPTKAFNNTTFSLDHALGVPHHNRPVPEFQITQDEVDGLIQSTN
jgi:guanine deaminase